jgi:hypothetical protein
MVVRAWDRKREDPDRRLGPGAAHRDPEIRPCDVLHVWRDARSRLRGPIVVDDDATIDWLVAFLGRE